MQVILDAMVNLLEKNLFLLKRGFDFRLHANPLRDFFLRTLVEPGIFHGGCGLIRQQLPQRNIAIRKRPWLHLRHA